LSDVTAIQKNGKNTVMAPHATASRMTQRRRISTRSACGRSATARASRTISVTKTNTAITDASPKRKNLNAVSYSSMMIVWLAPQARPGRGVHLSKILKLKISSRMQTMMICALSIGSVM
jgi:hypothetical protein